jgi:peptidoglycan/LPS O-acetylase OafA/YrhL
LAYKVDLYSKLKRDTTSNGFIPEIDGLRFFAIFTVVLFHLNTAISKELGLSLENIFDQMGGQRVEFSLAWFWVRLDLGVKVFFAISGFVLALPFLKYGLCITKEKVNLKDYFIRRLARLEPPFIVSLLLFYLIHVILLGVEPISLFCDFIAGLFYSHVFIYGEPNPINPVSWSLETEAQFYILIPFLFTFLYSLKKKRFALVFILVFFVTSIILKFYLNFHPYLGRSILVFFSNFCVGIITGYLYLIRFNWFKAKSLFFDFIGLIGFFGLFYFYKPQHEIFNQIYFNISIFVAMIAAFKGRSLNWFFTRRFIFILGGMCYSIYLIHYAFFHLSVKVTTLVWSQKINFEQNLLIQIVINVSVLLIVSILYFVYVEKPFMRKNWWSRSE